MEPSPLNKLIDNETSKPSSSELKNEADHVQLIDGEPTKDISLFSEIKRGDPVDVTLEDMLSQMTNSIEIDSAIHMVNFYRRCFPLESQHRFDKVLADLDTLKKTEGNSNSDSPYINAKRASEEGDLEVASHLYYRAISKNDKFNCSVKDLAYVMKRLGRTEEGIEMIQQQKIHCSEETKEFLERELQILYKVKETKDSTDSLYSKAKRASAKGNLELASHLYYVAISKNDRFDHSVKDLAYVLKRLGQAEEAVQMIRKHHKHCSKKSQESLDRALLGLYKKCTNWTSKDLEVLENNFNFMEYEMTCRGITTENSEKRSSFLGTLGWLYMKLENYYIAGELFREALSIIPNKTDACNLAVCLMNRGRILEAKSILDAAVAETEDQSLLSSYIKAYDRAREILTAVENDDTIND